MRVIIGCLPLFLLSLSTTSVTIGQPTCNEAKQTRLFNDGSSATLKAGRFGLVKLTRFIGIDAIRAKVKVKKNQYKSRWYLAGLKTRVKAKANITISATTVVENSGDKTLVVGRPFGKRCQNSDICVAYQDAELNIPLQGGPNSIKLTTKGVSATAGVSINNESLLLCATWGKKIP